MVLGAPPVRLLYIMNWRVELSGHQGGPLNGHLGSMDARVVSIGKNRGAGNRGRATDWARVLLWESVDVLDILNPLGLNGRRRQDWTGVAPCERERRVWQQEGPDER